MVKYKSTFYPVFTEVWCIKVSLGSRGISSHFTSWLDRSNTRVDYSSFHLLPSQTQFSEVADMAYVEQSNFWLE